MMFSLVCESAHGGGLFLIATFVRRIDMHESRSEKWWEIFLSIKIIAKFPRVCNTFGGHDGLSATSRVGIEFAFLSSE